MASSPPLDARDLAVRLEAAGISDEVARNQYGFRDTWDMACQRFRELASVAPLDSQLTEARSPLRTYLNGLLMALPLAICCAAMFAFQFSLWGGPLRAETATAIGLGTIFSFVLSGGFIQAMARQGVFYLGTRRYRRCADSTWRWFRWGGGTAIAFAVLALIWNAYFQWLPWPLLALAAAFQIVLGLFWLVLGMLHTHERYLWMSAVTALGVGVVSVLHLAAGAPLLASQLAGLSAAVILGIALTRRHLGRLCRSDNSRPQSLARARLAYLVWPYFLYGILYYLFLWIDRLLAWTAGTRYGRLPVEFRSAYEAGLAVALLAFVLQAGWVPAATQRFFGRVNACQRRFMLAEPGAFNAAVMQTYFRYTGSIAGGMLGLSVLVYALARALDWPRNPISSWAFQWALLAYPLVLVSLWNASLLFALSRPVPILKAVAGACLANLSLGYVLSRIGGHQQAVLGLALGALAFAALSSYGVARTLREADYFCFRAAS